jgi:hypothetical protein
MKRKNDLNDLYNEIELLVLSKRKKNNYKSIDNFKNNKLPSKDKNLKLSSKKQLNNSNKQKFGLVKINKKNEIIEMNDKVHVKLSRMGIFKKNDNVNTPKALFKELDDEFHFDFDPCPDSGEYEFDGLKVDWGKSNFVNPPYSEISKWIDKALKELKLGKKSVFLITARTSSKYWHERIFPFAKEIRFLKGSYTFDGYDKPFPVALSIVIFDPIYKSIDKSVEKNTYSYFPIFWSNKKI